MIPLPLLKTTVKLTQNTKNNKVLNLIRKKRIFTQTRVIFGTPFVFFLSLF